MLLIIKMMEMIITGAGTLDRIEESGEHVACLN